MPRRESLHLPQGGAKPRLHVSSPKQKQVLQGRRDTKRGISIRCGVARGIDLLLIAVVVVVVLVGDVDGASTRQYGNHCARVTYRVKK